MDAEEFETFFLDVYPQLVAYVRRFYDPSVAEDLASKTLEQIWVRGEPAPTDEHSFYRLRKLSFSILYRLVGHHMRSEGAHRRREQSFVAERGQRSVPDVADEAMAPAWPEWMDDLRDEERRLLGLHANGYKPAEIAPILGVRPSAVSARLQRVKAKARMLWGKESRGDQN